MSAQKNSTSNDPLAEWVKAITHPGFLACVVFLVVMTFSFNYVAKATGTRFARQPVPLRAPLPDLEAKRLKPFGQAKVHVIEENILAQLGTDKYIDWLMADPYDQEGVVRTEALEDGWEKGNWPRHLQLFVTYYTGGRRAVPHVPETCYKGSGHEQNVATSGNIKREDTIEVTIDGEAVTIPVRVFSFHKPGEAAGRGRVVMYTFHCNGAFRDGRSGVLKATKDSDYMYFCKIEVAADVGWGYRDESDAVEAAKRLLGRAAVVLVQNHFQDWETWISSAGQPD